MAFQITSACTGCSYCAQWCPSGAIRGRRKVRYAIDAAKCLECGACGRICTFQAVLDAAGRMAVRFRLSEWKKPRWNYAGCDRCGACLSACPAKCVRWAGSDQPDKAVQMGYPHLPRIKLCIGCGFCADACTRQAITFAAAAEMTN